MTLKPFLLNALILLGSHVYAQDSRSNILLIVADDLGYSSIEPYGSEIKTPFLNKIAEQSTLFTNFHTLPTCAPSRSVLMTGTDNHISGLGCQQGGATPRQEGQPGYEGHLNFTVATLPEQLLATGYRTYMTGKWHLGDQTEHAPYNRGFQETFSLISSGASHYADQIPLHPGDPTLYRRNGVPVDQLPPDFYSSKNYTDSLLHWLERDKSSEQPFFAYLAYTAPHDPLQAPKAYIDKYKGVFDAGYEALRQKKFEHLQQIGLLPPSLSLPEWPSYIPRWESLSDPKKQEVLRDMETYAAMVDYMDQQIGRVYQWLDTNDLLENTTIIFLSDNGVSGLNPKKIYPTYTDEFDRQFNHEISNRGLPNSFTVLYAGWAVAANVIFRDFKYSTAEGGIRAPCLIKLPQDLNQGKQICKHFVHSSDLVPTMLELAGARQPSQKHPLAGKSLLPILTNTSLDPHANQGQGFELHGARAYIKDGWKILQTPMPGGSGDWELYNLQQDPAEQNNLIFQRWDKYQELKADYQSYEEKSGVVYDFPQLLGKVKTAFNFLLWMFIVLQAWGLYNHWKISKKSPQGYRKILLFALMGIDLLGTIGLFTLANQIAATTLLATKGITLLILIRNKANWKAYLLVFLSALLLAGMLLLKSGRLLALLV